MFMYIDNMYISYQEKWFANLKTITISHKILRYKFNKEYSESIKGKLQENKRKRIDSITLPS